MLNEREHETFTLAIVALGLVLGSPVVGLIVQEDDQVAIIPRPGVAPDLFRLLGQNDWRRTTLIAEEHFA
jgi:hypothetical protein